MAFVLITLGILTLSLLFGGIYSYLLLYTNVFSNKRIRQNQLEPEISNKEFFSRVPLIAGNLALLYLISGVGLYIGRDLFVMETPAIWVFIVQFLVVIFIDDLMFYLMHRLLHENTYLNKKIHSIHHQANQPFPLDFIYAHPIEWLSGYIGAFMGILILAFTFGEVNVYAFWAYAAFRSFHEIDLHSGVKSTLSKYIPLLAGTEHHDRHHLRSKGNYASTLWLWDWILGTGLERRDASRK